MGLIGKGLKGLVTSIACAALLALAPSASLAAPIASASSDQGLAQSLAGAWQGTYTCSQGLTGLTLQLNYAGGEKLEGTFDFYEVPENPGVPTGSAKVVGAVAAGVLTVRSTEWIKQPSGYVLVGLKTTLPVEANGSVARQLHGEVTENSGCTTFDLSATAGAVRILSGPPKETASQKAVFTFSGGGNSFECSIDNGPFSPCSSGQSFEPIAPGDHLFQVRATLNGVAGPAAGYQWTVDLPRACVLRVARARTFVYTAKHEVRLVIRYTSYRPADVVVSYSLAGAKGGLSLGSASAHFKKAGVFRLRESLSAADAGKVRAAKRFRVHVKIPQTPGSCGRYYTKQLTIPKAISGQTVWFQSDSIFAS
jgi:hypothetical protein